LFEAHDATADFEYYFSARLEVSVRHTRRRLHHSVYIVGGGPKRRCWHKVY
jgi:hypothetical protein